MGKEIKGQDADLVFQEIDVNKKQT